LTMDAASFVGDTMLVHTETISLTTAADYIQADSKITVYTDDSPGSNPIKGIIDNGPQTAISYLNQIFHQAVANAMQYQVGDPAAAGAITVFLQFPCSPIL